jgi:NTP pyrophosphatase (non-canonical NTP hydrolase)
MKETEQKIRVFLEERGWNTLRPGDVAKSIAIESGELLEIFQWDNPSLEEVKKDHKRVEEIKKELADVLIYCFDVAILLDLDVTSVISEKLEFIKKKYPAEVFKNRKNGDPGTESAYWDIKKEYRKK